MKTHKGLSFKEALPKAKLTYHHSKSPSKGNPRPKKKARKVKRKMARKKRRRSRSMTIPLAPVVGLLSAPAINKTITGLIAGDVNAPMVNLPNLVGLWRDGSFHMDYLMANITPMIIGLLVHKFVGGSPLNLNRTLARARIPFLRI